jgi:glycerol-3-phosphate dehydrogenase
VHITVPRARLPIEGAAILEVAGEGRVVFIIPWGEHVYIGTTDTDYRGDRDEPLCTAEDVRTLLDVVNEILRTPLSANDVMGTWAGLRPLIAETDDDRAPTADVSRRHVIVDDRNGLVTVTGGKLTAYREMAEDTVDALKGHLNGSRVKRSRTKKLPISGAVGTAKLRVPGAPERLGISHTLCTHLVDRYGGHAATIAKMVRADATLGEPLIPDLDYIRAEALYAARFEMVATLADLLERRTRALMLDREATVAAAPAVAALIGPELGWDDAEQRRQVDAFVSYAAREADAAARSEEPPR